MVDKVSPEQAERAWMYAFIFFIILFLIAALVIIIIALVKTDGDLPDVVDVVLLDRNRERETGMRKAINKYMPWVNKIYVLSPNKSGVHDEMTYINFSGTQSAAFQAIPNIPFLSPHVMFLGDQTVPCRPVPKTYLFNGPRPRVFNILESQAVTDFFANYSEPVEPTMVADVEIIRKSSTTDNYILRTALTEVVTVANHLRRNVYLIGNLTDWEKVIDSQLSQLEELPPLFVTVHLKEGTEHYTALNNKWKDFLNEIED